MIYLIRNTETGVYKIGYCQRDVEKVRARLQEGNDATLLVTATYGGEEWELSLAYEQLKPFSMSRPSWYRDAPAVRDWFTAHEARGEARKLALARWRERYRPATVREPF